MGEVSAANLAFGRAKRAAEKLVSCDCCKGGKGVVVDARRHNAERGSYSIRRRYECTQCGARWTSIETRFDIRPVRFQHEGY